MPLSALLRGGGSNRHHDDRAGFPRMSHRHGQRSLADLAEALLVTQSDCGGQHLAAHGGRKGKVVAYTILRQHVGHDLAHFIPVLSARAAAIIIGTGGATNARAVPDHNAAEGAMADQGYTTP